MFADCNNFSCPIVGGLNLPNVIVIGCSKSPPANSGASSNACCTWSSTSINSFAATASWFIFGNGTNFLPFVGVWKFIIKKNDYSNEEISIKAKINDETLILTYNENEIQKRFRKINFEFYDDRIIVQKGNSLWRIARKTLGGGVFYTEIYKNNLRKIKNPNLIYPGQVFNIPIKRKKKLYE